MLNVYLLLGVMAFTPIPKEPKDQEPKQMNEAALIAKGDGDRSSQRGNREDRDRDRRDHRDHDEDERHGHHHDEDEDEEHHHRHHHDEDEDEDHHWW